MIFGEGPIIKNIAGDLNKLFLQGSRAGQPINNVEGSAAADQGTVALMADRDPVIRDISTGLGYAEREVTVSGTGALQLVNSLGRPLKAWEVDVLPKQDLHGYDSPWPVGGGVNKYDESTVTYGIWIYSNGTLESNALYSCVSEKISVPASTVVGLKCYGSMAYSYSVSEYQSDDTFITRHYSDVNDLMFTTDSNCSYVKVVIARYINNSLPITPEILATYKVEFVIASSLPASYSPYSNICPIHGTDKLNLFVEESYDQSATPKAVLTLPQTVYTGTIGSDGGESRWGEVTLNGTQTGILANWRATETSVGVLFSYNLFQNKVSESDMIPPNMLSDTLPTITYQAMYNGTVDIGISKVTGASVWGICIRLPDPTLTTAALVNQYLAEHPITVVYELATPTTFAITSPTIPTPTGTATTWATAEDGTVDGMEVTYYKSE